MKGFLIPGQEHVLAPNFNPKNFGSQILFLNYGLRPCGSTIEYHASFHSRYKKTYLILWGWAAVNFKQVHEWSQGGLMKGVCMGFIYLSSSNEELVYADYNNFFIRPTFQEYVLVSTEKGAMNCGQ